MRLSEPRQSLRSMLTLMAIERRAELEQRRCAGATTEAELLSEIEALEGLDSTVSARPAGDSLSGAYVR